MQPVSLFDLAAQQARWLSVRQAVVAGNIANVNTPGYRASDVEPFRAVLESRTLAIAPSQTGHIPIGTNRGDGAVRKDETPPVSPSGNTVTIENELVKAGEVRRGYELNTAIVKAFHRMLTMASRS